MYDEVTNRVAAMLGSREMIEHIVKAGADGAQDAVRAMVLCVTDLARADAFREAAAFCREHAAELEAEKELSRDSKLYSGRPALDLRKATALACATRFDGDEKAELIEAHTVNGLLLPGTMKGAL
jgi:hypothetical protein